MAEVSEIEAGGEVRTIKDATARQGVTINANAIAEINEKIPTSASSLNKMATQNDVTKAKPTFATGVTSDGIRWQRFGKVVTIQFDGTYVDKQRLTLPFAPAENTAMQLWWLYEIRGYADLFTSKELLIHTPQSLPMLGTTTYITRDNVY